MRIWITMVLSAAFVVALATNQVMAQQQSDITLRVANYGGVFTAFSKKYVGSRFTEKTGIKVEYIDANSPDHLAKLIASKGREPPYDVVMLDDTVHESAIAAGVIDKLDPALVPNLKYLYDAAKDKQGYGPAFAFYSVGIAYNVEKFKAAGIPEPTSWADLWDPRLAGHVAVPDPSSTMGRDFLLAAAQLNGGNESTLEKGVEKIATLKAQSYPDSSATIETLFRSGDIWVSPWLNGRTWAMIDKGAPLAYVLPKGSAFGHGADIDLVRGTKYPKEAQAYINMAIDPLAQLGQTYEVPYGPVNQLLAPILAAYPDMAKKFPASPEDIKKLSLIDWSAFNKHFASAMDEWNRKVMNK